MALKKKVKTPFGVDIDYFKIVHTVIVWHTKTGEIRLSGFVDEKAKNDGAKPIIYQSIQVRPENFPFDPDRPVVADAYNYIKSLKDWNDAIDV
jgi:hypothetical protein